MHTTFKFDKLSAVLFGQRVRFPLKLLHENHAAVCSEVDVCDVSHITANGTTMLCGHSDIFPVLVKQFA